MQIFEGTPPKNTKRIARWNDLPSDESGTLYRVTDSAGQAFEIYAKGKRKRVLEGLIKAPLQAASYARLSQQVSELRAQGLEIETRLFKNDVETQRERYGVYFLLSKVTHCKGEIAA